MFGRAKKQSAADQELIDLRRSIQSRGQADIAGATAYVGSYLGGVATEAGTVGNPEAELWLQDRLRLFAVVGFANWFDVVDRVPEGPTLQNEWRSLCYNAKQFGPEHLIAWWWLLQESLFRPLIDNQLSMMRGALTDGVRDIADRGGKYAEEMVDWENFFS